MYVPGEPRLLLGSGIKDWTRQLSEAGLPRLAAPMLRFVVSGFRRRGHWFDLDNLAEPVLPFITPPTGLERLWAIMEVGAQPGVDVSQAAPPPPPVEARSWHVQEPPRRSTRTSTPHVEGQYLGPVGSGVGCELLLGPEVGGIKLGLESTIKATIDGLWPVLGGNPGAPDDHRVRELRVRQGDIQGVRVTLWLLAGPG